MRKKMMMTTLLMALVLMAGNLSSYAAVGGLNAPAKVATTGTPAAVTAGASNYTDISAGFWAQGAITAMSARGIVKGYPDGAFKPSGTVTYAEFIKMALIADTGKDVGNAKTGNWATNYYNAAVENGYFTEYDIALDQLDNKIPRGDMAMIISAILGDVTIVNYDKIQQGINDITYQTPHEYDITKVYAAGIITGYDDGSFMPKNTLTRAESATVIDRLVNEADRIVPAAAIVATSESAIDTTPDKVTYKTNALLTSTLLTADKIQTEDAHFTDEYEVVTAKEAKLSMIKAYNGSIGVFKSNLPGFIYLVKGGAIVELCETMPMADEDGNYIGLQSSIFRTDISKADYIISVPTDNESDADKLIMVIANPFK